MVRKYVRKTTGDFRRPGPLVDAQPAIDHVRQLVAKGMTTRDIIEKTGLASRTVHGFLNGWIVSHGSRRPVKQCGQNTLDIVLAIEPEPSWTVDEFQPDKFRGAREARGLSRATLGKMTGLCPETFQYWESGRSKPTRRTNLDKALKVLGLELDDVSGPVEDASVDEFTEEFRPAGLDDLISDYPCCVCGGIFRSRSLLATHPHARRSPDGG